jgi:hypothetical protein
VWALVCASSTTSVMALIWLASSIDQLLGE